MEMQSLEDLMDEVSSNDDLFDYNYYHVRATVSDVKTNLSTVVYKGCQKDECMKKVLPQDDGWFFCPKCDRSYQHFKHRYKLKVKLEDGSAVMWVTMFDEAIPFLGKTASELVKIYRFCSEQKYESVLYSRLNETFDFTIKSANVVLFNREWVNGIVVDYE